MAGIGREQGLGLSQTRKLRLLYRKRILVLLSSLAGCYNNGNDICTYVYQQRRLHPTAQLIASKLTRSCSLDAKGQVAIETRPDPGNRNLPSPLTPDAHSIRQIHYSILLSGSSNLGGT